MSMLDRDIVAGTIYGESRGETTLGRLAVACVIQNRVKVRYRGAQSWADVCLAPKQFSCWNLGDPNRQVLLETFASDRYVESQRDPLVRECYWIAEGVIGHMITPQIGNCLHYYATWLPSPPSWAAEGRVVATIGRHVFLDQVK